MAAPVGAELRGGAGRFHLRAGDRGVVIDGHGVLEVDMRMLVARLQERALAAGAVLVGGLTVRGREGGRLITDRGVVQAGLIVDAAGLAGPNLLGLARVPAAHLCAAAQEVRVVRDPDAARRFFAGHGVAPGEVLCFAGVAGGFSVVNARLDEAEGTVGILTGSIPADGHPSGKALLDRFVAEQGWIGRTIFGGARAIPLCRSPERFAWDGVAALGDSACQVFPAHGSGIGTGMIAARLLAEAVAAHGIGAAGLRAYEIAWMRQYGGLCAAYDLFRRFSQSLAPGTLEQMIDGGLLDPVLARAGMAQAFPRLPLARVPAKVAALARVPALGRRLAATASRMVAVRALYAAYPRNVAAVPRWARLVARLYAEKLPVAAASSKLVAWGGK